MAESKRIFHLEWTISPYEKGVLWNPHLFHCFCCPPRRCVWKNDPVETSDLSKFSLSEETFFRKVSTWLFEWSLGSWGCHGSCCFLVLKEKKSKKFGDCVQETSLLTILDFFWGLLALLNPKMWPNWYFVGSRMRLSHLLQERRAQQERRAGEHLPGEEGTLQLPEVNRICCIKKKLQKNTLHWKGGFSKIFLGIFTPILGLKDSYFDKHVYFKWVFPPATRHPKKTRIEVVQLLFYWASKCRRAVWREMSVFGSWPLIFSNRNFTPGRTWSHIWSRSGPGFEGVYDMCIDSIDTVSCWETWEAWEIMGGCIFSWARREGSNRKKQQQIDKQSNHGNTTETSMETHPRDDSKDYKSNFTLRFPGITFWKELLLKGIRRIPNHWAPNHKLTISWAWRLLAHHHQSFIRWDSFGFWVGLVVHAPFNQHTRMHKFWTPNMFFDIWPPPQKKINLNMSEVFQWFCMSRDVFY